MVAGTKNVGASVATSSYIFVANFCPYCYIAGEGFKKDLNYPNLRLPAAMYLNPDMVGLLCFIRDHCMRIRELLNIKSSDFIGDSRFVVRGLKKSRNYTVKLPVVQLSNPPKNDPRWDLPVVPYSYMQVWNFCRKNGYGLNRPGKRYVARTHAHRYETAQAVANIAGKSAASDVLHHNSKRSVDYYIS